MHLYEHKKYVLRNAKFYGEIFSGSKNLQKYGHGPALMFSMSDMTVPVSFADNTFWSIKKDRGLFPGPFNKLCVFLLLAFLSASSACEDDSQSGSREGEQERDPVIRLVTGARQLVPAAV